MFDLELSMDVTLRTMAPQESELLIESQQVKPIVTVVAKCPLLGVKRTWRLFECTGQLSCLALQRCTLPVFAFVGCKQLRRGERRLRNIVEEWRRPAEPAQPPPEKP